MNILKMRPNGRKFRMAALAAIIVAGLSACRGNEPKPITFNGVAIGENNQVRRCSGDVEVTSVVVNGNVIFEKKCIPQQ